MNKLPPPFRPFLPMVEGITQLFSPFVEVAIHDLNTGKLIAVYNNVSKRKIGDKTPLELLKIDTDAFPDFFLPYLKESWDKRTFKCTSITVRDEKKKPIGLICYNFDISCFEQLQHFLKLPQESENPVERFGGDYQEEIDRTLALILSEKGWVLNSLTSKEKRTVILELYHRGLFNYKNSVPYVSEQLKICRATVYNHLKSNLH